MQALLHRVVTGKPLGILKYAMTLDGKIATSSGHSAWVTSPGSRAKVFDTRARSDAVIVGGQTLRRDNPRLTTRRESGHTPVRILMSRTLDLPLVSPTIEGPWLSSVMVDSQSAGLNEGCLIIFGVHCDATLAGSISGARRHSVLGCSWEASAEPAQ